MSELVFLLAAYAGSVIDGDVSGTLFSNDADYS